MADWDPNKDPYAYLRLSRDPDGTVKRIPGEQETPASSDPAGNPFHFSKDVPINQSKGTFARIFVPREAFDSPSTGKKLPIIVYFHSGGFVIRKVSSSSFDLIYATVVAGTPAVVVSVGYRLAPEHRLPAAYDDCEEGLNWLTSISGEDEWLKKYADFSNCFLMGSSAGGNVVYHIGIQVAAAAREGALAPIRIRGLIMHIPFFGGVQRSGSEMRLEKDREAPLVVCDLMWDLCLPVGADRDHEYCNPAAAIRAGQFEWVKELGWKVLVIGYSGDPFFDRQVEVARKMEENGVAVVAKFEDGGCHGCDLRDPHRAKVLSKYVKEFVDKAAIISS